MRFSVRSWLFSSVVLIGLLPAAAAPANAQSSAAKKAVQITFLPPPIENASYSVGIYEAKSGKLVRRLHEAVTENVFTAGLNGFITKWDGKDDAGKPVPPGRYAARGYAVGPLKVEGVEFLGNDWVSTDEGLRIQRVDQIELVPEDDGLAVLGTMPDASKILLRVSGKDGSVMWKQKFLAPGKKKRIYELSAGKEELVVMSYLDKSVFSLSDGSKIGQTTEHVLDSITPFPRGMMSDGKERRSFWMVTDDALYQFAGDVEFGKLPITEDTSKAAEFLAAHALRTLPRKDGEPQFRAVTASLSTDRLYLLEEMPGWQRVRGLSWVESKEEDGKKISNWDTFFERNIRQADPARGLDDPATGKLVAAPVKLELFENALTPGKAAAVELLATFDDNGSYLATADGLHLRKISERSGLRAVKLTKAKTAGMLSLFQNDGAAWEEFSIEGARQMMSFDAGEIEMSANGEKPVESKAAEPPDL